MLATRDQNVFFTLSSRKIRRFAMMIRFPRSKGVSSLLALLKIVHK